jgi:ABC-type Na+ transport system ATPase subunit NatA
VFLACRACESNERLRYVESIFSFQRPGIGFNILYALVETVIFFAILWVLEHPVLLEKLTRRLRGRKTRSLTEILTPITDVCTGSVFRALPLLHREEDSDVTAEREKVKNGEITDEHVVVIKNLIKIYPRHLDGLTLRPKKVAVKGITLAIPKGECFGLLGTNGAGKTTTFRMLTGDLNPTSGSATIKGLDVITQFQKVRQHIGYCPQFGALLERLSGRELLTVFARLRGIPESAVRATVESEIRRVDLVQHADKLCGKYSGGNKRKLSTGIALVGNPAVVFLDEPTTGMDTATRHFLWKVLAGVAKNGQSIILTSHR